MTLIVMVHYPLIFYIKGDMAQQQKWRYDSKCSMILYWHKEDMNMILLLCKLQVNKKYFNKTENILLRFLFLHRKKKAFIYLFLCTKYSTGNAQYISAGCWHFTNPIPSKASFIPPGIEHFILIVTDAPQSTGSRQTAPVKSDQ